ncbi:MAG: VWA domain-containing protein [Xanthomonadales bacterium]|nr:VWA domain-containing protein [Xanthomonadales bacterium]
MDLFGLYWIRPHWLLLLPVIWLAAVFAWRQHKVGGDWARVADAHLLKFLGGGGASQKSRHSLTSLITAGLTVALLALAGPAWEQSASGSFSANQARVVILDLSRSMLAEDIKPSRIARARFKLMDFLDQVEEGQVGLVAYAGQAFVIAPLSSDMETIKNMVPALYPDIMPAPGSRPDEALALAAELINQAGFASGEILLIADSSDQRTLAMAARLADRGFSISVLGIGTPEGAPIPSGRGFIKDHEGKIVVARLEERKLRAVARAGSGQYLKNRADNSELAAILKQGDEAFVATDDNDNRGLEQRWLDQGYWLVILLLPLVLLSFRKGWLFVLPILLLPHTAQRAVAQPLLDNPAAISQQTQPAPPAEAYQSEVEIAPSRLQQSWRKLWRNADQRAQQQLQQQQYTQALESAQSLRFQAEALYRQGDYNQAMNLWKTLENTADTVEQQADAAYNLGNALAAENELDDAIAAYTRSLELNPDNEDAQTNIEILEKMKDQQGEDGENKQEEGDQGEDQEQQQDQSQDQQDQDSGESEDTEESADDADDADDASEEENQDEEQQQQDEQEPSEEQQAEEEQAAQMTQEAQWTEEDEQAKEQWLRRIPDDPGGLLRRKLIQEHKRRGRNESESQPW